jgi:ATP-dependent RNA helicase DeaD
MTQCIIFLNKNDFVERLRNILENKGCEANIMHGGLEIDKRVEMMAKFRKGEVRHFITTNLLAR